MLDVHQYGAGDIVRWLEEGLIRTLGSLGFPVIRRDTAPKSQSLVGIWTCDHRKVASIGMRIRRGVTSHGFALNIDPDMSVFSVFTPCGLPDVAMTSLAELSEQDGRPTPDECEVRSAIATALAAE